MQILVTGANGQLGSELRDLSGNSVAIRHRWYCDPDLLVVFLAWE